MKKWSGGAVIVFFMLLGSTTIVHAEEGYALAKKSKCTLCHLINSRIGAPSLKMISEKYKNNPGARDALIQKVKLGGGGTWGKLTMPANSPRVSDEDIAKLVDYVMTMDADVAMGE